MKDPKWMIVEDDDPGQGEFATERAARLAAADHIVTSENRIFLCRIVAIYEKVVEPRVREVN